MEKDGKCQYVFRTMGHQSYLFPTCCYVTSVVSDSVRPHRRQPTRLPCPWDSPGKNIGVGCHFFLQCIKVKSGSEVAQLSPTLSDPMDCSLPGFSVHGIFQARVLEWGAIAFSVPNLREEEIAFQKCSLCPGTQYLILHGFHSSLLR